MGPKKKMLNGAIVQRAMKWDFLDGNGHGSWIDSDTCSTLPLLFLVYKLTSCAKNSIYHFFSLPRDGFLCVSHTQSNPAKFTPEWRDKMIDVSRVASTLVGSFTINLSQTLTLKCPLVALLVCWRPLTVTKLSTPSLIYVLKQCRIQHSLKLCRCLQAFNVALILEVNLLSGSEVFASRPWPTWFTLRWSAWYKSIKNCC